MKSRDLKIAPRKLTKSPNLCAQDTRASLHPMTADYDCGYCQDHLLFMLRRVNFNLLNELNNDLKHQFDQELLKPESSQRECNLVSDGTPKFQTQIESEDDFSDSMDEGCNDEPEANAL